MKRLLSSLALTALLAASAIPATTADLIQELQKVVIVAGSITPTTDQERQVLMNVDRAALNCALALMSDDSVTARGMAARAAWAFPATSPPGNMLDNVISAVASMQAMLPDGSKATANIEFSDREMVQIGKIAARAKANIDALMGQKVVPLSKR